MKFRLKYILCIIFGIGLLSLQWLIYLVNHHETYENEFKHTSTNVHHQQSYISFDHKQHLCVGWRHTRVDILCQLRLAQYFFNRTVLIPENICIPPQHAITYFHRAFKRRLMYISIDSVLNIEQLHNHFDIALKNASLSDQTSTIHLNSFDHPLFRLITNRTVNYWHEFCKMPSTGVGTTFLNSTRWMINTFKIYQYPTDLLKVAHEIALKIKQPFICVHVRRGDKLHRTANCTTSQHIRHVLQSYDKNLTNLFLATNEINLTNFKLLKTWYSIWLLKDFIDRNRSQYNPYQLVVIDEIVCQLSQFRVSTFKESDHHLHLC